MLASSLFAEGVCVLGLYQKMHTEQEVGPAHSKGASRRWGISPIAILRNGFLIQPLGVRGRFAFSHAMESANEKKPVSIDGLPLE